MYKIDFTYLRQLSGWPNDKAALPIDWNNERPCNVNKTDTNSSV
jgi:hypothetical protein